MTPEEIEQMRADMAEGTQFWGDGAFPSRPVPLSGLCLSLYSKASADMESAANTRRFLRLPALEAEILYLTMEKAALAEELARLRYEISEASHPDFLFGAMDNVHDMDSTLTDYASAASRAIRAALSHTGMTGSKEIAG